jgi:hypothetical protein
MICANTECKKDFEGQTHNQKYCCDNCCRVATNKRIMEKYYEKKAIRAGEKRKCKNCSEYLSRYNDNKTCSSCIKKIQKKHHSRLMDIINDIG